MDSKLSAEIKRWIAIIGFIVYDVFLIFITGHLRILPADRIIFRYEISWSNEYLFSPLTIVILLVLPFILSYIFAILSVAANSNNVQIVGSNSLLNHMKMKFHSGNPEGKEFNLENVQYLLDEMAEGEPPGTVDNLEMLFSMGLIVENLIEKANVPSVKRVYMSDELAPNAFTLRFLPIPFIGQDWIIVNRNVIDILEREEIEAVVAHEIGHADRKDSWLNSLLYSPQLIIIFGFATILAGMAGIILNNPFTLDSFLRLFTLILVLSGIKGLMNIGKYFTTYAYRKAEFLADYYAANLVGSEDLINALIKIGRRGEVIRSINMELEWLEDHGEELNPEIMRAQVLNFLEPDETSKQYAQEFTIRFYVRAKLMQTLNNLRIQPSQDDFEQMVDEGVKNLCQERGVDLEGEEVMLHLGPDQMENLTSNWKSFDFNEDDQLDREEIDKLIAELKQSDRRIFETETLEELGVLPSAKTHPQVSDRILFVYDQYLKDRKDKIKRSERQN